VQVYESAGLKIELLSYGRLHSASFDVEPGLYESGDLSPCMGRGSWYCTNNVFDVLAP
jgi:hypothetical protein